MATTPKSTNKHRQWACVPRGTSRVREGLFDITRGLSDVPIAGYRSRPGVIPSLTAPNSVYVLWQGVATQLFV